jgi:uncharacterized protein (DUF2342 family)
MPITHTDGATILTGEAIDFYRIATLRGAVGLELKGIKMTRGPVVWKRVAREFGIKGNKQAVYDWLCAKVEELKAQQVHIDETTKGEQ